MARFISRRKDGKDKDKDKNKGSLSVLSISESVDSGIVGIGN